ncbi:hypothetical protein HCU01_01390 [Halomonas cupida]|uniref:Transposase n=1 Tax=Halomonas cupida TaxID=44933 RepID=A0ABQ0W932_9GAMM|nr:hypothetical protein HCU01_01390 [Halomonas cupida]
MPGTIAGLQIEHARFYRWNPFKSPKLLRKKYVSGSTAHDEAENATGRLSAPPKETKHTGAFNTCILTYHPLTLVETSR